MNVHSIWVRGIRCFEDTGRIDLSPGCNIFVGQNNAGKSTILKAVLSWQISPFKMPEDARPGSPVVKNEIILSETNGNKYVDIRPSDQNKHRFVQTFSGSGTDPSGIPTSEIGASSIVFAKPWPSNFIVPFIAKRKAVAFQENISLGVQGAMDGTFSNLYARIDRVASPGTAAHETYRRAVEEMTGVFITTQASLNGKMAGYHFNEEHFVTLDRMGDGVSEIAALALELSMAKGKLFVLEEPETNLHPKGLKALLNLIRESATQNQFIIATHSNIVVRELASDPLTKTFRVYRDGINPDSPSRVEIVEKTTSAHLELLRELGYEFGDFNLHEGWLFLEESSAESIFQEILIPWFVPGLSGKLRTFSAGGVSNLEPTVSEFQRLIAFVHLNPVYRDRLWVRADGDDPGKAMVASIEAKFPYLAAPKAATFSKPQFELFYPEVFAERVAQTLALANKKERRSGKTNLLAEVIQWSLENKDDARAAWAKSAAEQILLLEEILRVMPRP